MTTTQRVVFDSKCFAPVSTAKRQPLGDISKKINTLEEDYNLGLRQVNDLTMTSNGYTALNSLLALVGAIIIVPLVIFVSTYALVGLLPLVLIGLTLAILAARKDSEADDAKSKLIDIKFDLKKLQPDKKI